MPKVFHPRVLALLGFALLLLSCGRSSSHYVSLGDEHARRGRFDEAILNYRKALQADGRYGPAYYRWGVLESQRQRYSAALQLLQQAVSIMPDNQEAILRLTDTATAIYFGSPNRPPKLYELLANLSARLLKADPNSYDGLRIQGYLAAADRNPAKSVDLLSRANQIRPLQPNLVMVLFGQLVALNRAPEAEDLARRTIKAQSSDPRAYDVLYEHYVTSMRVTEAEALLKEKVSANPKVLPYLIQLAAHYERSKDRAETNRVLDLVLKDGEKVPEARMLVGDFHFANQRFEEAEQQYEVGAASGSATSRLGYKKRIYRLLRAQNKLMEARKYARGIVDEYPNDSDARATWASSALAEASPADAATVISDLVAHLKDATGNADFRFQLGRAYDLAGQAEKAVGEYQQTLQADQTHIEARFALCDLARRRNDSTSIVRHATEILAFEPENIRAKLMRSTGLIGEKKFTEAGSELADLRRKYPQLREATFQMAMLRLREARYKEAEQLFRALNSSNFNNLAVLKGLSEVYAEQKQFEQAIQVWKKELANHPEQRDLRANLAEVAMTARRFDAAAEQYQLLCKQMPGNVFYLQRLGQALVMQNDLPGAMAVLMEAQRLKPDDVEVTLSLAVAKEKAGRLSEAVDYYRRALKFRPTDYRIMNNLAFGLAAQDTNLDEALALAQAASQRSSNDPVISATLGIIYMKKRLFDSALPVFSGLVQRFPDNAIYRYQYAMTLAEKGNRAQAKTEIEAALKLEASASEKAAMRAFLARL